MKRPLIAAALAVCAFSPAMAASPNVAVVKRPIELQNVAAAAAAKGAGQSYDVQTVANSNFPKAGVSGNTVPNGVQISLYVARKNGQPVTDLGSNVGDGTGVITLPSRVGLFNRIVPAGGCSIQATEFMNWGDGYYTLRAAPNRTNPSAPCAWGAGQYDYYITIKNPAGEVAGAGLSKFKVQ